MKDCARVVPKLVFQSAMGVRKSFYLRPLVYNKFFYLRASRTHTHTMNHYSDNLEMEARGCVGKACEGQSIDQPAKTFETRGPETKLRPERCGLVQGWESVFLDDSLDLIPTMYNRMNH